LSTLVSNPVDSIDRVIVLGISYSCPFKNNCLNCPVKYLRSLSHVERFDIVETMADDEIAEILDRHEECADTYLGI
jgi:hypothetical protein